MPQSSDKHYSLSSTTEIIQTSENGDRLAIKPNVDFDHPDPGFPAEVSIHINPEATRQTINGIGSSFTESSAFVLAHLDKDKREEVMNNIYGEQGANFTLFRTVIGASDFSVEGRYSYDDVKDDRELAHFSIQPDKDGFCQNKYPGIRDNRFDVLPMIKQAISIKQKQNDSTYKIIASAWTAPAWMKDIEDWYQNGNKENNYQGTGGVLKKGYEPYYANYLVKYLDHYQAEGVDIWGFTPVNEPGGNNGQWESMHFTAASQNDFIKYYLGPALIQSKHPDTRLYMFDHNRDSLDEWAQLLYNDKETSKYLHGAAVHWYESTVNVYEDVLDQVHQAFPQYDIIHTEGCIDDLGKDAPEGVLDPVRFKESNWFDNDDFWWNNNATDWAYTVTWEGVNADEHPIYTPVHRYAKNIIVSLNNWLSGWIDWNIVLDKNGGPNHVGNFCGAPIMIDTETGYVYYTPVYYILSQLSRTIRPGDKVVEVRLGNSTLDDDAIHSTATINDQNQLSIQVLNTTKKQLNYLLQIGHQAAEVLIDANSLQTARVQL